MFLPGVQPIHPTMKTRILVFAAALLAAGVASAKDESPKSASRVQVVFVAPENFTDFKDSYYGSDRGREHLMNQFRAHLEWLARYYVPDGAMLEVKFTDIDLAGDFEPWRSVSYHDIRILKEIYPPRMTLDFRLVGADGKVIAGGNRKLTDLNYLMRHILPSSDSLRYDKEVLSDWFRSEFRRNG